MWVSHFGTHCIWYITQSPWSWNQSGVSSAKARLMFDLSPFGGSLVTLTLFCRTDTGNDLAGIELRYSRKPECTSSGFSAMDLTISSIDNIHDAARWQFYIKTSRKRHSLTAVVDVKLKLPSLIYALQYRLTSRKPLWSDMVPVDRHPFSMAQWLEFGYCGQLWLSPGPYYPSSGIQSAMETVVYSKSLQNKPRTLRRLLQALGPSW